MDNIDFVKLVGQGGIAVAALFVLAKMVYRIGERMIAAIDRVGSKIEEHTKADLLAHADVGNQVGDLRQDVAVLSERVDTVITLTRGDRSERHVSPHEERAAFGSSPPPGPLQPLRHERHTSERFLVDDELSARARRRRDDGGQ